MSRVQILDPQFTHSGTWDKLLNLSGLSGPPSVKCEPRHYPAPLQEFVGIKGNRCEVHLGWCFSPFRTLSKVTVITTTQQKLSKEQVILNNFATTYYLKVSAIFNLCRQSPLRAIAKVNNQQLIVPFIYL